MEEPKLTIGELDLKLYFLIREAVLSGVPESDLWASFEAAVECAKWFRGIGRGENVIPIR